MPQVQVLQLKVDASGVVTGASKAKDALGGLDRSADKTGAALDRLKGVAQGVAGVMATLGAGKLVSEVIAARTATDRLVSSLTVATGSYRQAGKEIEFLRSEARRLGVDFQSSAEGYAKFAISLKGTRLEGQAGRQVFTGFSEALSTLGASSEQSRRAFLALEQMVSKGTVSAEELRQQLGEALPGATRVAADAMGVTTRKLLAQIEAGEVLAEDLLPRMAAELNKTYGVEAPKAADRLRGTLNRLNNELFAQKELIAQQLAPVLTRVARETTEWLQQNKQLAAQIGGGLADGLRLAASLAKTLAENLSLIKGAIAAIVAAKAANTILDIAAALKTASAAAGTFGGALTTLAGGPVTVLAAAIAGIGIALNSMLTEWRNAMQEAINYNVEMANAEGPLLRLVQAAETGTEVSRELFEAGTEGAEKMRAKLAELEKQTKRLKDEEAKRLASMASARVSSTGWTPVAPSQSGAILTNEAEIARLQRALENLEGALLRVKVAADQSEDDGPPPGGKDEDEIAKLVKQYEDLRGGLDAVYAAQLRFNRGVELLDKVKPWISVEQYEETIRQLTKELEEAKRAAEEAADAIDLSGLVGNRLGLAGRVRRDPISSGVTGNPNAQPYDLSGALAAGNGFWDQVQARIAKFTDWMNSRDGGSLIGAAYAFGDALVQAFKDTEPAVANFIVGLQNAAGGVMAALNATNAGDRAVAGLAGGAGIYQMGQGAGVWDAGRGTGEFGGQLSGNYADVGAQVGGAIGAVLGGILTSQSGGWGAGIGTIIGGVIGGVVGSAIKSGADEGLAQLRRIGDEISVRITKDEGGLGGMVAGIGREISQGLERILTASGGTLDFLGDLDLKIRDDQVIVFVNGLRRAFKEVSDAVSFGIAELLRTAEVSGLSANQQSVLGYVRGQQPGSVTVEEVAGYLEFATALDRINFGPTANALAQLNDWFRVTSAQARELGFSEETLAQIRDKLLEGYRAARQTIEAEIASLSGLTGPWTSAVDTIVDRIREATDAANDYNTALTTQNQKDRDRLATIQQQITATQAALAADRARLAALGPAPVPSPGQTGSGGPRDAGTDPLIGPGGAGGSQENQAWIELNNRIRQNELALRDFNEEMGLLGSLFDEAAIDVEAGLTNMIKGTAGTFDDLIGRYMSDPVSEFAEQAKEFDDAFEAAGKLRDKLLETAETEEQRALILEQYETQMERLAEAEAAMVKQTANQLQVGIFDGLASLLNDGPARTEAMRRGEELKYHLALANLKLQYQALVIAEEKYRRENKGAELVGQTTLNWIRDTIGLIDEQGPPRTGGGGGGGGKKQRRESLLDEIADRQRVGESGLERQLRELAEWEKKATEEAKKLGISLDEVRKASEAQRAALKEQAELDIAQLLRPFSAVKKQVIDLKKWRSDMEKVAVELGIPFEDIRQAFEAGIRRINRDVKKSVADFQNIYGGGDLRAALGDNSIAAETLRQNIRDMTISEAERAALLEIVNDSEARRAELLKQQSEIGFLEGLDKYIDDTELSTKLAQMKARIELDSLQAQLRGLSTRADLDEETRAQYREWLAEVQAKLNEPIPEPPDPLAGLRKDFAAMFRGFRLGGDVAEGFVRIREEAEALREKAREAGLATEAWLATIDAAEEQLMRHASGNFLAGMLDQIARYTDDEVEKQALLQEAAQIRYDLEKELMAAQMASALAQQAITQETFDRFMGLINRLPPDLTFDDPGGTDGPVFQGYDDPPPGSTLADRQREIEEFYATLAGFRNQTLTPNEEFQQLLETFEGLRADALRLGLDVQQVWDVQAEAVRDFFDRLVEGVRDLRNELFFDQQLSTATPYQRYQEAVGQFADLRSRIEAGDLSAISELDAASRLLLSEARAYSPSQYGDIEAWVRDTLDMVEQLPGMMEAASPTLTSTDIYTPIVSALHAADMSRHEDQARQEELLAVLVAAVESVTAELRGQAAAGDR